MLRAPAHSDVDECLNGADGLHFFHGGERRPGKQKGVSKVLAQRHGDAVPGRDAVASDSGGGWGLERGIKGRTLAVLSGRMNASNRCSGYHVGT